MTDTAPPAPRHGGWIIAACMCASSLAFLDGSVTNVALPAISQSLAADPTTLPWIINAYLLPLSALLLFGGATGDHFGRRRMLILGVIIFALASLGCALSKGTDLLLASRALQGIGAAILMPNSLGLLGSSFHGEARGRAIGTWASAGAIASAVGPPLGGWLVDTVGWRAIFYLNLPVAVAAIAIAWRFVPESPRGKGGLDWLGAALATAGLGALTWALTLWSSRHALSTESTIGVVGGVALLLGFVLHQHRLGERAMMPLALFGSVPFVGLTVLTLLLYGALGGLILLLPYLLIVGGGYAPSMAGLALLPFSIVIGTASRFAGRLAARIGGRLPLSIGPIVTGIGFWMLSGADPQASYWTSILPGMLVLSLGMAGAVAPLTTAVLASVDDRFTGTASGFNSAIARTGGLVATALAGAVLSLHGAALVAGFQGAALVCAGLAITSGVVAFVTLKDG
jgi:EmrB/QacA subfamily drug resistance transporter